MEIVYVLIPLTLILVGIALVGYIWAVQSGQFEDCDTPPLRILHDDDCFPDRRSSRDAADKEGNSGSD